MSRRLEYHVKCGHLKLLKTTLTVLWTQISQTSPFQLLETTAVIRAKTATFGAIQRIQMFVGINAQLFIAECDIFCK